jgi:uncharacterized protein YheU (UPF0270 family)
MNAQLTDFDGHDGEGEETGGIVVPHRTLSKDALRGVVESFVLREGTDYGHADWDLEAKVTAVIGQIERDEARIVFDPETESIDIVTGPRAN